MIELIFNTARNIGLGIFVNGAFALQFAKVQIEGYLAVAEGIVIMLLSGYMELRSRK